jgi:hypothetical protein
MRGILNWIINPDNLTAASTFVIAIFTVVLAIVSQNQGRLIRKTLELSRDEFNSSHRPKLVVRQFQVDSITVGNPINVQFAMVNIGSTEAFPELLACGIGLWNVQSQFFEPPGINTDQTKIAVPPIAGGQRESWHMVSQFAVTPEQLELIQSGSLIVQILGEITYRDRLNRQRRTGFRRAHDRFTNKFGPSPDPEDEYQD